MTKHDFFKGPYRIVGVDEIPSKEEIVDVPLDDPVAVYNVCLKLRDLCQSENGLGLSAVQVGIPWKLFLIRGTVGCSLIPADDYGYFVNCEYEVNTKDEPVLSLEGCLSLRSPDGRLRSFQVERPYSVQVRGQQLKIDSNNALRFEKVDESIDVMQGGIVFQHEADHSFSKERLICNIGKEIFVW
jgi:peptide deformylase